MTSVPRRVAVGVSGRSVAALVVSVLVLLFAATGCRTPTEQLPELAEITTTTDPDALADLEPAPSPDPAPQVAAALADAAAGDDFCALLTAIDATMPDRDDPDGAILVYDALAAATVEARGIVPDHLRESWEDVVAGTTAAAAALRAAGGDVGDPDVTATLESRAMTDAALELERHQIAECPPPVP